jgi:hypothetical protein
MELLTFQGMAIRDLVKDSTHHMGRSLQNLDETWKGIVQLDCARLGIVHPHELGILHDDKTGNLIKLLNTFLLEARLTNLLLTRTQLPIYPPL